MAERLHQLKTIATYFDAIKRGEKNFEVRLNDRGFQTGDLVRLLRCDEQGRRYATDESLVCKITYILQGGQFGIEPRHCVMALSPMQS